MKKTWGLLTLLVILMALLCACGEDSEATTPEPSTMEHVHQVVDRANDETHHYDVCSCGEIMNRQEHTYSGEWVRVKGGGCDDYSAYVKDCDGCYFQLSREEEPSGHDFVDYPGQEPTCSEDGYFPYTECSKCGLQSSVKEVWPATGAHSYDDDGKCRGCGVLHKGSSGLEMTLSNDGTYYIVTGSENCTAGDVVIPVEYKGKPVRVIGENAFTGNETMFMVRFFSNVKRIEANAFGGCSRLNAVQFREGLEYIGEGAFARLDGDVNLSIGGLPQSLEYIGDWAFMGCQIFTLDLPKNVSYIGQGAFDCTMLLEATCHKENKYYYSSGNCLIEKSTGTLITTGYGTVNVPDDGSVKRIATCAFGNAGAEILDFYIPASVTYIGQVAFYHWGTPITVHFGGTRAQWEAIEKESLWCEELDGVTVICTDD